jgi:hypothetical protein
MDRAIEIMHAYGPVISDQAKFIHTTLACLFEASAHLTHYQISVVIHTRNTRR